MKLDEYQNWDEFLASALTGAPEDDGEYIQVVRRDLETVLGDLSKLIYATERRYQDTADRLIYEHRERFRLNLIAMNDIRLRLNSMLRGAR